MNGYTIWPPLPRRVRLKLWLHHHIDGIGIWLVNHGHLKTAVFFWRLCGTWQGWW